MAIEVKKREGESVSSFLYRFNKRIQHSGLIREVKKRQFRDRTENRRRRRLGALHRLKREEQYARLKKHGYR